ncbi:hypothetical protein ACFSTD_20970 [Novosphingobium colocasiae]
MTSPRADEGVPADLGHPPSRVFSPVMDHVDEAKARAMLRKKKGNGLADPDTVSLRSRS